jgi:hypothetical protein
MERAIPAVEASFTRREALRLALNIAFCRAATGEPPAIWTDAGGGNERCLTGSIDDLGADHPRWLDAKG